MLEPALPGDEDSPEQCASCDGGDWNCTSAILCDALDAVNDRQDREERKSGACNIELGWIWIAKLRQQNRPDNEQCNHDRDIQQKHRAPPEMLQHYSAEYRPDCAADNECIDPHCNRESALVLIVKHVADECHGRRHQCRAC